MPEFYMILDRKVSKIPEFLLYPPQKKQNSRILYDFCPKSARILHYNCPKNIFPEFYGGTCPPAPVSYAYELDQGVIDINVKKLQFNQVLTATCIE